MPQTYQCDLCQTVAGDFMVTAIANGQVICVGVECLPLWAIPAAAGWAEALIDQGAGVPEWAAIVIDANHQLAQLIADGPVEAADGSDGPDGTNPGDDGPGAATGREPPGDGPSDDVREDPAPEPASHDAG